MVVKSQVAIGFLRKLVQTPREVDPIVSRWRFVRLSVTKSLMIGFILAQVSILQCWYNQSIITCR